MTDSFKSFLSTYTPADKHFTSWTEVETIANHVFAEIGGKENATPENIRQVRNQVVNFFHPLIEPNTLEAYNKMTSLQSVTAAIDHLIYTVGGEV